MSAAIEDIAKKWLAEPYYTKVFKHTFDVVEDYLCYALTAIGSIALAVRFLTSLGSGEVVCVLTGVRHNDSTKDLGPYPAGNTLAMIAMANFNQKCSDAAMTPFLQYLPFLLIFQAIVLIAVEKLLMHFPRVSGKIERFYGTIVEESLFGKDPDVTEDVCDDRANSEAISRRRRRNEICMGLKRSSIIHNMYIFKNVTEVFLLALFISVNLFFGLEAEVSLTPSLCILNIEDVPELDREAGILFFQCEGKKVTFFLRLLYVQIAAMLLVAVCSIGSLIWCLCLRSVSKLLSKIENSKLAGDIGLATGQGKDFLFLFDLLSHTSGIESTLRVLTHADDTFRRICLPKLTNDLEHIRVEEDKVKVLWDPAGLELWLRDNNHKGIVIDSYDVTIFPAETVNNSKTLLPAEKDPRTGKYTAWFFDLQGGKTEYVITIACVIGKSRMKGERIVTTLLPYGPQKPRGGILRSVATEEVEIGWEPPKGGFTKYVLAVDPTVKSTQTPKLDYMERQLFNPRFYMAPQDANSNGFLSSVLDPGKVSTDIISTRELTNCLTDHKITGLCPGCTYGIELKTITGSRQTRQPIFECVLTKPLPVESLRVISDKETTDSALIQWVPPEGHKRLTGFDIEIKSNDGKVKKLLTVKFQPDAVNSFLIESIPSGTEYTVNITTVCFFENLKSLSEMKSLVFCTCPDSPTNLTLENRSPNSFTVKWEAPSVMQSTHRYRLQIEATSISYSTEYSVPGDKTTFNFSKLPDILGTGTSYTVRVEYIVTPAGSDQEVHSAPLINTFTTKPLAPTNFKVIPESQSVSWVRSPTPNVTACKVRWRSVEEGSKAEEAMVAVPEEDTAACVFQLWDIMPNTLYKVNIYAVVEDPDLPIESNELQDKVCSGPHSLGDTQPEHIQSKGLHEKVILVDGSLAVYSEEMERVSVASGQLDTGLVT